MIRIDGVQPCHLKKHTDVKEEKGSGTLSDFVRITTEFRLNISAAVRIFIVDMAKTIGLIRFWSKTIFSFTNGGYK